jgi:hypothetical protein
MIPNLDVQIIVTAFVPSPAPPEPLFASLARSLIETPAIWPTAFCSANKRNREKTFGGRGFLLETVDPLRLDLGRVECWFVAFV